jgi:hypothetical protein
VCARPSATALPHGEARMEGLIGRATFQVETDQNVIGMGPKSQEFPSSYLSNHQRK